MTIGDLLSKNTNSEVMFHLTKTGETTPFAIVSAGSSEYLADDITAKEVQGYSITNPSKVVVTVEGTDVTDNGEEPDDDIDGEGL